MRYDGNCHFSNDGIYVEGRWFGNNLQHARAFAEGLVGQYDRPVDVIDVSHHSTPFAAVVETFFPVEQQFPLAA